MFIYGRSATPHSAQSKMRKIFLLALYVLLGCTSQLDAGYTVFLKNTCSYPIDVSSPKYPERVVSEERLNPDETVVVIALICTDASRLFTIRTSSWASDAMGSCLPVDYKLKIAVDDKERVLDKQQVLNVLERAEYEDGKLHFLWTISDPTLCPK